MAIQFCANDNRAFDDTRIGRQGGLGGQCVVCNQQACFDCMQNRNNVNAIVSRTLPSMIEMILVVIVTAGCVGLGLVKH